ncbi:hypothetical protein [Streptomyces microflavus]|uniref:hypothetical protein n=1 Tax=Streptomyces microflavus TaxID=1919 RepID=UPI003658028D
MRTVLRSSYSGHWRRMLSPLLGALELKCNNTAYRPVMDAIDLLKRYLDQPIAKEGAFFDESEKIPLPRVASPSTTIANPSRPPVGSVVPFSRRFHAGP